MDLPQGATRATGDFQDRILYFTGTFEELHKPVQHPSDLLQARRQLHVTEKWAISQLAIPQNVDSIVDSIRNGEANIISDGSFKEHFGTSAFSIGTFQEYFVGVNLVPGSKKDHTPHRAELAGIIGGLTVLKMISQTYALDAGRITIGLDGQNAMNRAANESEMASFADWDLIKVVHSLMDELPFSFEWRWIEGHQDDSKSWGELENWAKRNVLMDSTAKQFWQYCHELNKRPYQGKLYGEGWSIRWNGRKLPNFHLQAIYDEHWGI